MYNQFSNVHFTPSSLPSLLASSWVSPPSVSSLRLLSASSPWLRLSWRATLVSWLLASSLASLPSSGSSSRPSWRRLSWETSPSSRPLLSASWLPRPSSEQPSPSRRDGSYRRRRCPSSASDHRLRRPPSTPPSAFG